MASHLYDMQTCTPSNAIQLLTDYQRAHKLGVPHKKAMQFAVAQGERRRQGSPDIPLTAADVAAISRADEHQTPKWWRNKRQAWQRCRWWRATTPHANADTFRRLLIACCGVMPSLKGKPQKAILAAIAKGKPERVAACKRAVANYKAVVGRLPQPRRMVGGNGMLQTYLLGYDNHRDWLHVCTARQLFVKGWGKFAIGKQTDYVTPAELTAAGYGFSNACDLRLAKSKPWRAWFTRHWQWWRANLVRIDELSSGGYRQFAVAEAYLREHPDCTPQGLLTHIAGLRARDAARRERYAGAEYGEGIASDAAYPWLANVQPSQVTLADGQGTLAPVRDGKQLSQVARELGNCASMYHADIAERECMLVVLCDQQGQAIGLGELLPNGKWGQVSGIKNAKLADDVKRLFREYTPQAMLACWVGDPTPQLPPS